MMNEKMKTLFQRTLNAELEALQTTAVQRAQLYRHVTEERSTKSKAAVGVLLATALALLALTGLAVSVFNGFVFLPQEEHGQLYSCVVKDECMYVLGNNGLWVYRTAREPARQIVARHEIPRYANPLKLELLASEPMMLMDREANLLWVLETDGFVKKRSYTNTQLAQVDEYGTDFVWQDGTLFIQSDHNGCIYRVSLDTCEAEKLSMEHVIRLAAYKPGELLALTYSQQQGTAVWMIDTSSGKPRKLCGDAGLGIKGVSYSVQKEKVYAIVSGTLSCWNGTEWQKVCGVALPHVSFFLGIFGDTYAAVNHEGVQFIPLDGMSGMEETIVIHGMPDSARYDHGFQQTFPGLTVARRSESAFDMEDAVQVLSAGTEADLLHVRISTAEVDELWTLTGALDSAVLREDVKQMIPVLQKLLYHQNQLYAFPSEMIIDAWKTDGIHARQPMDTLNELLASDEYRIGVETFEDTQKVTVSWNVQDYAAYLLQQALRERNVNSLRFTDAAFISTLQALQTYSTADKAETWYHTVMSLVGYLNGSSGAIPYTLPPTITADATPQIPASVTVYMLNPASQHKEAAIRYLEYLAENRFSWDDALMKPACAQPVLGEWAQKRIEQAPDQRVQIEADPQNWEVLTENLTFYREKIAPCIIFDDSHPKEAEMLQLIMKCVNEGITAEECAQRLERMAE